MCMCIPSLLLLMMVALRPATAQFNKLPSDGWPSSDPELDCAMRKLAFEHATALLGADDKAGLARVAEGLQFGGSCTPSGLGQQLRTPGHRHRSGPVPGPGRPSALTDPSDFLTSFYVATTGSDGNVGTAASPFKTLHRAATAALAVPTSKRPTGVFLRNGTHYLTQTLELGPGHSGTTFAAYPGEHATISGGQRFAGLKWSPAQDSDEFFGAKGDAGVLVTDVPKGTKFIELFANGQRQIRARWPNGNQNRGAVYPHGYAVGTFHGKDEPANKIVKDKECRQTDYDAFPCDSWVVGGSGARYDPPFMFNDADDLAESKPTSFTMTSNSASRMVGAKPHPQPSWSNVQEAIMTVVTVDSGGRRRLNAGDKLRGPVDDSLPQWGGWQAALQTRNGNKVTFKSDITEKGMWQDQAQTAGDGDNGAFFVENVKEELDVTGEWYLDTENSKLYYKPNSTQAMQSGAVALEAPQSGMSTLVHITGSQAAPATDIAFQGLIFAHSEPTVMRQYYIPSCGDWSIYRGGLVYIEGGARRLRIDGNVFHSPGGNAIFAFGYLADSNITRNEFSWMGNNAIAFAGRPHLHDITGGNYPQDNLVEGNHCRENGVYDFESSFFFEAIAGHNTVRNNVIYNGPRAAINFNDGAVGGTKVEGNLIFGHGRESSDHGPINSWDRCPFKSQRGDSLDKTLFRPQKNIVGRNFVINGGILFDCITHDDGASYYIDDSNVLLYGGVQNNNAYHNAFVNNLVVQPHINSNYPMPGYDAFNYDADSVGDSIVGNTVIMKGQGCNDPYGSGIKMDFGDDSFPKNSSHNTLYNDNGKWDVITNCDPSQTKVGCFHTADTAFVGKGCTTLSLKEFQSHGMEKGSQVFPVSSMPTAKILSLAKQLLRLPKLVRVAPRNATLPPSFESGAAISRHERVQLHAGSCTGLAEADCAVWTKFWNFANGAHWTSCNTLKAASAPCSECKEIVTCKGSHISAIDLHTHNPGAQGPVVWLMDGSLSELSSLVAGETLQIHCSKGSDFNETKPQKATVAFTCVESGPEPKPPSPSPGPPPGPLPPAPAHKPAPAPHKPAPAPKPKPAPAPKPKPAPAPKPPTPSSGYKSMPNHSCDGNTIKELGKVTLAEAEKACDANTKCNCICQSHKTKAFEIDTGKQDSSDKTYDSWVKKSE